jgi:hypothetical protein
MKTRFRTPVVITALLFPIFAFAQTGGINTTYIKPYSDSIVRIINDILVPVILAIAFLVFLWGVYKYFIQGAADEESRKEGRQFVLWGIIGFVIIFTVWAIVRVLMGTLGLSENTPAPNPPTFNPSGTTGSQPNTNIGPPY